MPKRTKNAFWFYMMHYRKYEESNGRRFTGGNREVADAAGACWQRLSKEEKQVYERQAKEHKVNATHERRPHERYTSSGVPLSQVQQFERDEKNKIETQHKIIDEMINYGISNNCITKQNFCILSFNYFIKDLQEQFYPCELGMVRFSLKDGAGVRGHDMIDPGKLPTGYAYTAMTHSNQTHKIPYPPLQGNKDYESILLQITEFVSIKKALPDADFFPILVANNEMKMVENIVAQLCDHAQLDAEMYRILPLTYFFSRFRQALEELYNFTPESPFNEAVAQIYLEKDQFQYLKGNGCNEHEKDDVNFHCAVSRVVRAAYTILIETLDIADIKDREPGYHYPHEYKAEIKKKKESDTSESDGDDDADNVDYVDDHKTQYSVKTAASMRGRIKDEFSDTASSYSRRTDFTRDDYGGGSSNHWVRNPFAARGGGPRRRSPEIRSKQNRGGRRDTDDSDDY